MDSSTALTQLQAWPLRSRSEETLHRPLVEAVVGIAGEVFLSQRPADRVIERTLKRDRRWGSRDRRFIAESAYDLIRHARLLSVLAKALRDHSGQAPDAWDQFAVLRHWRSGGPLPDWPEFAARGWLKRTPTAWQTAIHFEIERLEAEPAILYSMPDWLFERAKREIGETWLDWCKRLNQQAPVVLRFNPLRIGSRSALIEALAEDKIDVDPINGFDDALILRRRQNVFASKAFQAGAFEVQDGHSQRVVDVLQPQPGERIVDACAGAGGKTLHAASRMQNRGRIIALDVHQWKLDELRARARRAGADIIETRLIDSSKTIKRLEGQADRLLLDVPCSGLGVLRRNPDSKWRITEDELTRLTELQSDILKRYSRMLKTGGRMVYSTCSLLPSENETQIHHFLNEARDFELERMMTLPVGESDGFDGFFIACLRRV